MYDLARITLEKDLPPGTFAGVPFLIKDLLCAYAGVPMTMGSKAYRNYIPQYDSEQVKRYKRLLEEIKSRRKVFLVKSRRIGMTETTTDLVIRDVYFQIKYENFIKKWALNPRKNKKL